MLPSGVGGGGGNISVFTACEDSELPLAAGTVVLRFLPTQASQDHFPALPPSFFSHFPAFGWRMCLHLCQLGLCLVCLAKFIPTECVIYFSPSKRSSPKVILLTNTNIVSDKKQKHQSAFTAVARNLSVPNK